MQIFLFFIIYALCAAIRESLWKWSECSRSNLTEIFDLCLLNRPTDIWSGLNRSICGNYIVETGNFWHKLCNH